MVNGVALQTEWAKMPFRYIGRNYGNKTLHSLIWSLLTDILSWFPLFNCVIVSDVVLVLELRNSQPLDLPHLYSEILWLYLH